MYYTVYKITNKLDQKVYVGAHVTVNTDDGYMGSGKYIKRAIKKFGVENFSKEILFYCKSKDEMYRVEASIVTDEFIRSNDTYNLKLGGSGGNPYVIGAFTGMKHTDATKEKIRQKSLQQKMSDSTRHKISINNFAVRDPVRQRKHASVAGSYNKTEEHRQKISQSLKNNCNGGSNLGKSNLGKVRSKVQCPYCEVSGSKNTMVRWHFENCKSRVQFQVALPNLV